MQFERIFDSFVFYAKRNRRAEIPEPAGDAAVEYWNRVYGKVA